MTQHRQFDNSNRVLVAVLVDSGDSDGATAAGFVAGDPAPGQRAGPPASVSACRSSTCHDVVTRQSWDAPILTLQAIPCAQRNVRRHVIPHSLGGADDL